MEQNSIWMEFLSDHAPSEATSRYSCFRLQGCTIEGRHASGGSDSIATLLSGCWITAVEHVAFEKATAYGDLGVVLQQECGFERRMGCEAVGLLRNQLVVDGRPVAQLDLAEQRWTSMLDGAPLRALRIESMPVQSDRNGKSVIPSSVDEGLDLGGQAGSSDAVGLAVASTAAAEAIGMMLSLQSELLSELTQARDTETADGAPASALRQQHRRVARTGEAQRGCLQRLQRVEALLTADAPIAADCLRRVLILLSCWQRDTEDELSVQVDGRVFARRVRQTRLARRERVQRDAYVPHRSDSDTSAGARVPCEDVGQVLRPQREALKTGRRPSLIPWVDI